MVCVTTGLWEGVEAPNKYQQLCILVHVVYKCIAPGRVGHTPKKYAGICGYPFELQA